MTPEEILDRIESGKDRIVSVEPKQIAGRYDGNVRYVTENGIHVTIFWDCNELDYVDNIVRGSRVYKKFTWFPKSIAVWRPKQFELYL